MNRLASTRYQWRSSRSVADDTARNSADLFVQAVTSSSATSGISKVRSFGQTLVANMALVTAEIAAVCARLCELRRTRETAAVTIACARQPMVINCVYATPTRQNGCKLQRTVSREFAQQNLHEEQQASSLDAAVDSCGERNVRLVR